jgi:histidinol dehydrogenase
MRIVDFTKLNHEQIRERLGNVRQEFPPQITEEVKSIIVDVSQRGDDALIESTRKFDGVDLTGDSIEVDSAEIEECRGDVDGAFSDALDVSIQRVTEYHRHERVEDRLHVDGFGNTLGRKCTPVEHVGIYIPGGKASYPSTLVMTAIPAIVAGVERISLVTPPSSFIRPSALALAIQKIGRIDRVYRVGGVQGVAALALGTESVQRVDKIVGPGNMYVTVAKKELYGYVDIDMVAGPSEVLVITDGSSDSGLAAVDLIAQAEHDERARAMCVATSMETARAVEKAVERLLKKAERRKIARESIEKNGTIFVVSGEETAAAVANALAPEHLEIQTRDPRAILPLIRNAGAIFLGAYSAEAFGDYVAGPSHVLPTGGTARFFSPLSVLSFMKFSSVIDMSKKGMDELGPHAACFAEKEGLSSHAGSIYLRKEK